MRKSFLYMIILFVIVFFLSFYKLDYYIMKPGSAYNVSEFVTVEDGDKNHEGTMSLMTVAMAQATPLTYAVSYFSEYEEVFKEEEVRQEEEDEKEYSVRQLKLMSDSQFNALYVAFQKANLPYTIEYHGVTVLNVLADGAADGELEPGDEIVEIDGVMIEKAQELTEILSAKKENEAVELVIDRDDKLLDRTIKLKPIPGSEKVGIGITYSESKLIKTDPNVKVDADKIGGPSAGLMFTLEILNQLLDDDLTKGYSIAGTGEMNEDGTVGRIGGIEKKVVAADRDGVEIFFAPDDEITQAMLQINPNLKSNYDVAVETAEKIDTDMEIVPVKTIDDAIDYIEKLQPKKD
ncbi:SepM family pheromone-processing serine protease [Ureibacillus sinduriensis]|uniref:endopeptidase La n=1 Tax=Ureibacillus sinduriensis BLB-1 = JCM 15800 TaxID=1384057 RepID=A0A0A3HRI4_9BACL|nr:SepM family pheromone-processing serine protease [Ureibacillus sinduriensis]KGR73790.1 peptidase [Ureibacillus sinduriensis BLB-1 = JCM 15800]